MSDPTETTSSRAGTVRANLLAVGIAEAVARVAQLALVAVLGRSLGPDGLGIVGVAWAVYQLALPFVQYAPELIGTREVAQGEEIDATLIDITAVKLVIALMAALVATIAAALWFSDDVREEIQVLAQVPLLLAVSLNGVWAFRGVRRFAAYAVVRSAHSLALLACLALLLQVVPAPWIVPAAETAVGLLAAALAYALLLDWRTLAAVLWRTLRRMPAVRARTVAALRFGLGGFFAMVTWSAPLLIARLFLTTGEQGQLAAALRLIVAVNALYQLALQVFHPILAHRYAQDRAAGRELAATLTVYALAVTVPVVIALIALAPWIVTLLLGADFTTAAAVFAAVAPVLIPTVIGSVFGYALMADGRYGAYVWMCGGGALATVAGCAAAFYVWPHPEAVGVLTLVTALVAVIGAVAAWRLNLLAFNAVHWRQLAPSRIRAVLRER
jgi:O-antigen/teichoic acid export membrane protein